MIANAFYKPLCLRSSGKDTVIPSWDGFEIAQDVTDKEDPTACLDDLWFSSTLSLILSFLPGKHKYK